MFVLLRRLVDSVVDEYLEHIIFDVRPLSVARLRQAN